MSGANSDRVLQWEHAEAAHDALLCDYLGGHPAFAEPIANGLLRRVGTGIRFQQMRSEGTQLGWYDAFEVGDATIEHMLPAGHRRSMRLARTISNVVSFLESLLGGAPIERRPEEVVVHAVIDGMGCRLRFAAARGEAHAWRSREVE